MGRDVVVVGSFVVGATVRLPRMPYPGETLVADLFDLGPGGKGTNMAVTVARQGHEVTVIAKIGEDIFADIAHRLYEAEGMDTQYLLQASGETTAIGLVYLQESGENTIGLYRGANWTLQPDEIDLIASAAAEANVLLTQLEIPDEAVLKAVQLGHEHNAMVILNPAPARQLSSAILQHVTILTPNESEARLLAGLEPNDSSISIEQVGERLLNLGIDTVIITLGADGSLIIQRDEQPLPVPAYPVETVDTVGAGDAFNGGLAVALAEGRPLGEAVRWASVTAALSTRKVGAVDALPTYDEVQQHFSGWH